MGRKLKLIATHCSFASAPSIVRTADATRDRRDWQLKKIVSPASRDLVQDARDRVFICDGLRIADFERAPESRFERIGASMLVDTVVTGRSGVALRDKISGRHVSEDEDGDGTRRLVERLATRSSSTARPNRRAIKTTHHKR